MPAILQLLEQCMAEKKTVKLYLTNHVIDGAVLAIHADEIELRNREQSRIIILLSQVIAVSIA
jgi:hypothetical protein